MNDLFVAKGIAFELECLEIATAIVTDDTDERILVFLDRADLTVAPASVNGAPLQIVMDTGASMRPRIVM